MKYCPKCKNELPDNYAFCSDCGGKLIEGSTQKINPKDTGDIIVQTSLDKTKTKKKGRHKVKALIACVLVISIILSSVYFIFFYNKSSVESNNYDSDKNYVAVSDEIANKKIANEKAALKALDSMKDRLNISDTQKDLKSVSDSDDDREIYYFNQMHQGIPVYGRRVAICVDKNKTHPILVSNTVKISLDDLTVHELDSSKAEKAVVKYAEKKTNKKINEVKLSPVSKEDAVIYTFSDSDCIAYCIDTTVTTENERIEYKTIYSPGNNTILSMREKIEELESFLAIFKDIFDSFSDNTETQAVGVAVNDILTELDDADATQTDPDWIHKNATGNSNDRNIIEPSKSECLTSVSEISDIEPNSFAYSTIISHTAYLMFNGIDGDKEQKISIDLLAQLWGKAMYLFPTDVNFKQCANIVASVGEQLLNSGVITNKQYECIKKAFSEVGLMTDTVASGSELTVYDKYGNNYDNYHIKITEISDTMSEGEQTAVVDEDITTADPYLLDLKPGSYNISVSNLNKKGDQGIYTADIIISEDENAQKTFAFYTDYGVKTKFILTKEITTSDSGEQITKTYTYDDQNNLIETNTSYGHLEDGEFFPDSSSGHTWKYDAKGRIIQDKGDFEEGSPTHTYTYDSHGNVIQDKYYSYDGENEYQDETSAKYTYDKNGRIATGNYNEWQIGKYVDSTFKYDAEGNLISMNDDFSDTDTVGERKHSYSYDSENNTVKHNFEGNFNFSTGGYVNNKYSQTFDYNKNNQLLKFTHNDYVNDPHYTTCTYDSNGNCTKVESTGEAIEWTYDDKGNIINEKITAYETTFSNSYEYDDNGNVVKRIYHPPVGSDMSETTTTYTYKEVPSEDIELIVMRDNKFSLTLDNDTFKSNGKAIVPSLKLSYQLYYSDCDDVSEKVYLLPGIDYIVTYKNNVKPGTATGIITFISSNYILRDAPIYFNFEIK